MKMIFKTFIRENVLLAYLIYMLESVPHISEYFIFILCVYFAQTPYANVSMYKDTNVHAQCTKNNMRKCTKKEIYTIFPTLQREDR